MCKLYLYTCFFEYVFSSSHISSVFRSRICGLRDGLRFGPSAPSVTCCFYNGVVHQSPLFSSTQKIGLYPQSSSILIRLSDFPTIKHHPFWFTKALFFHPPMGIWDIKFQCFRLVSRRVIFYGCHGDWRGIPSGDSQGIPMGESWLIDD